MPVPNEILTAIAEKGGVCYAVGGSVIDHFLNLEVKDWDIEVHKVSYETLLEVLINFGEPSLVGQAFGVVKLRYLGVDYDFSLPREENKNGLGHKDFSIRFRPDISIEEAAKRRDLTINSISLNLHTMEYIDPYEGIQDLKNGVIRATDSSTFIEDPLRPLRAMQILARKGRVVALETIELCKSIKDSFDNLPKERIFEEFKKLLLKSSKPSVGLQFLIDSEWIDNFPELKSLIGVPQHPDWHPEGDVWTHTLLVVDRAAELRSQLRTEKEQLALMFAAICHDFGKAICTDLETFTAYGHDAAGAPLAEAFMRRMTNDIDLIENIKKLTYFHMRPYLLTDGKARKSAWAKLNNSIDLKLLSYLTRADKAGRTDGSVYDSDIYGANCIKYALMFENKPIPKILTGRHLIKLGYLPGREMGNILKRAYDYQIEADAKNPYWILFRVEHKSIWKLIKALFRYKKHDG